MSTEKIMEQAQVFASAWSVVGGPCGRLGDAMEVATQEKDELRRIVSALVAERDCLAARLEIDPDHGIPDGIDCRNATIEIQDAQISALAAKLAEAEETGKHLAQQLVSVERERGDLLARLAELEGQEPVAWVEVVSTHEGPYNFEGMALLGKGNHLLYARTVPAEPVNVRLLEALKTLRDALRDHPEYAQLSEEQEEETGGDTAEFSYLVRVADEAIAAAEAQQERLLQDMHDAGREIDRVMAEPAQKAPQIDLNAIARAIWNVRREEEDRCDMELEDVSADHSVWEEASEVASILKDAGIEVAE